jgi:xanthine dehydrogenase YagR molybdenum-binding subunit
MTSPSRAPARIGDPLSRVDGRLKVTGHARYAAEHPVADLLYGWVVSSGIAKGRITAIHEDAARAVSGVVEIITHKNRPDLPKADSAYQEQVAPPGSPFRALFSDEIQYSLQPVVLVVAQDLETARYAASLIKIEYETAEHNTDFRLAQAERYMPSKKRSGYTPTKNRGDVDAGLAEATHRIARTYHMGTHVHNPMEMHATTVVWEGAGRVTVYDKTQGSQNTQKYLSQVFGLKAENVRILNPYVGGAFGSGLRPQYQSYLAMLAATMLERSVRVVMTRPQMFSHVHRPEAMQAVTLGTDDKGHLLGIRNEATTATSRFEDYMENVVNWGLMAYASPNAEADYKVAPIDTYTPGDMRAPGAATGMNLFEIAMDEMAFEVGLDPLDFRLLNYSEKDAMHDTPYTSKALREAYAEGAAKFGWERRSQAPRSMQDGTDLVGWGLATGMWDATFQKSSARARLSANGELLIETASSDIGTGTYTILAQIASDTLGIPVDQIQVKIGDSHLPMSPIEGGSWTAASAGAAVEATCRSLGEKLFKAAEKVRNSPLEGIKADDVMFDHGRLVSKSEPTKSVSYGEAITATGEASLEVEEAVSAGVSGMISQMRKSRNTHSAVFAEVKIDEELGVVRVTRVVCAVAAGRIINPKTARSQILGGVVMGIGMALHEETFVDHRLGRIMNHDLAEYHVPANADIGDIEVIFVNEPDPEVTPMGVKGVGEIGIVGTAAAVANAIFHATGKRLRDLPITIDKIIE